MIKAITFDLWNTLFKNISYTDRRKGLIKRFSEKNGFEISDAELTQVYNRSFNFLNPPFKTTQFKHIYTSTRIKNMFDELKIDLKLEERKELIKNFEVLMLANPPTLKKGVFDTLSSLSIDFRIGLISDTGITPGRIIKEVLKDYNILDYFDVTVFSDETGFYKPHPIAFKTALSKLDCSPKNAIHVGDLLDTDIKGAIGYEMHSIWIRDDLAQNHSSIVPDYEISEIPEILDIIEKLNLKKSNL